MENINISNIDLSGAASGGGSGSDVTKAYVDAQDKKVEGKIPTKTSQLTNDSGYLTEHQSLDNYYTKEQTDSSINAVKTAIPTKTSQLTNDSGWIPENQISNEFSRINTATEYTPAADGETVTVTSDSLMTVNTASITSFTVEPSYVGTGSECVVQFDGKAGLSVSFPADLKWADGQAPVIEAGKTYQVSMQNGTACWKAFSAAV